MSPFDTIFGLVMVGLCAAWLLAALILGLCRAAAKDMPAPDEYEASPYGPMRRFNLNRLCELRGHQYGISQDGTAWVCVRGDDRVPVQTDIDTIENYANGGAA